MKYASQAEEKIIKIPTLVINDDFFAEENARLGISVVMSNSAVRIQDSYLFHSNSLL